MSRGLALLAVLAAATAVPAAAGRTIPWTVIGHGIATGEPSHSPVALVATSPSAAHHVVTTVPPKAAAAALRVNYRLNVLVGVFGAFGCTDGRVRITGIDERASTLVVKLVVKPLPPGVASCMALYQTYRLLVVPRHALAATPTAAKVTVARA